jgi:membrane-associated phospholipid phosphatase
VGSITRLQREGFGPPTIAGPMTIALALALSITAAAPHPLKWDPRIDFPVTGVLVTGWVVSEFAVKAQLAPDACHWCATNGFDTAVRKAFNPTLTPSSNGLRGAATASDVLAFVGVPLVVAGLDALGAKDAPDFLKTWGVDLLLMLEATFSALAVNQTVKFSVGRARPYTVDAPAELLAMAKDPHDHNLSFFSGHTTFTVGLSVSAGVIGLLRGYRFAWLTWAVAVPMALTTATLRMAADKHWMSDVLVGAAIGSAFSIAIPLVFHGREGGPVVRVTPTGQGISLAGTF